jgi:hypothetical protein
MDNFTTGLITGTFVMNDDIFMNYGGAATGLVEISTEPQRYAAYQIAEQWAMNMLSTYLVNTRSTGVFAWPSGTYDSIVQLPITHVTSLIGVTAIHGAGCSCDDSTFTIDGCAYLKNGIAGIIDLRSCGSGCSARGACTQAQGYQGGAYQAQVILDAGYPAGQVAGSAMMLAGLTIASRLALQILVDPSGMEGGLGNPGLTSYSDTGYSESRAEIRRNLIGNSPEAMQAGNMIKQKPFYYRHVMRMR